MAKRYETIVPKIFLRPEVIHITLLMLPLGEPGQVEKAIFALKSVEDTIKNLVKEQGVDGKLILEYEKLEYFGTPDDTRVIYMKPRDSGS